MRIVEMYSHLNGHEHILVHKPETWDEIEETIAAVDAAGCRTKVSKEKRLQGKKLYSPIDMNVCFKAEFRSRGWEEQTTSYYITADVDPIRRTLDEPAEKQREMIEEAGQEPIYTFNQTDFVKSRLAIEVQLGKYAFVAYDLFVKHMAFFVGDVIDVGIEILPMKELQAQMSSGVPYYEKGLYDLIRQGRGVPAVPLVIVGIAP